MKLVRINKSPNKNHKLTLQITIYPNLNIGYSSKDKCDCRSNHKMAPTEKLQKPKQFRKTPKKEMSKVLL